MDRLEFLEATADFLEASEARELARRKLVRLARRIVLMPEAPDEEVLPAAFRAASAVLRG